MNKNYPAGSYDYATVGKPGATGPAKTQHTPIASVGDRKPGPDNAAIRKAEGKK